MRLKFNFQLTFAVAFGFLMYMGCTQDENIRPTDNDQIEERGSSTLSGTPVNAALIGLTPENQLVSFMSGPPVVEQSLVAITGLRDGESILAIDTRPRTKELYGISNQSILYKLSPTTGVALPVSGNPIAPAINGDMVAFDFNPVDDRIRLITSTGQNLRIDPLTGVVVAVDVNINSFTAYINSATITNPTLYVRSATYVIDITDGALYRMTNPNGGSIVYVGSLGFNFRQEGGFEATSRNSAFTVQYGASKTPSGGGGTAIGGEEDLSQEAWRLYTVNLGNGALASHGKVRPMIGLASR